MNGKEYNLLIIDDSIETLELIERILKPHGYHVYCASNGETAIEILKSKKSRL